MVESCDFEATVNFRPYIIQDKEEDAKIFYSTTKINIRRSHDRQGKMEQGARFGYRPSFGWTPNTDNLGHLQNTLTVLLENEGQINESILILFEAHYVNEVGV
jgi:hypothetical protein